MRETAAKLVRRVLAESEDEFGYSFGSPSSLYDIFVKPVVDVGRVAGAEAKKTAARGKALAKTAFEAIVSTLVPILDADFEKISAEAREKISHAHRSAGDAYDEVKRAIGGSDAVMAALLYAPAATLTLATGGTAVSKVRAAFGLEEARGADGLRAASDETRLLVRKKLRDLAAMSKSIASARDAAQLAKIIGAEQSVFKRVDDVTAFKRVAIERLASRLEAEAKKLVSGGAPRKSELVKDYVKTVEFMRSTGGKLR